jgi:predicted nuclease of predicted toxin-antitoxin system
VLGAGACPSDEQIWEYARLQDLVIVTKDEDFQRFSVWRGFPPKVVWIQLGNCSTKQVADLLRASRAHSSSRTRTLHSSPCVV